MDMISYLTKYAKEDNVSFHMPGHKGSGIFKMCGFEDQIKSLVDMDVTEIVGADNLYHANGIIKDIEDRYQKLYDSKRSFLLVNGTSCGIVASIMACLDKGDKLLMTRASHKSVYNGVYMACAEAVYVMPETEKSFDVIGKINPDDIERALERDESIKAVMIASPNYYGICSDVEKIAEIVHNYGKILIVDQAHGAHLKLFEDVLGNKNSLPKSAESAGADIVINSTHKTLASFTQSAVLNVMSDRIDFEKIFDKLQLVQSTSPSYLLMLSHAMNLKIIEDKGQNLIENWNRNIEYFYQKISHVEGVDVLDCELLDKTKINISLSRLGLSGDDLEKELLKRGIYMELVTGHIIMAMTGIGNTKRDFDRLIEAFYEISYDYKLCSESICDTINRDGEGYVSILPGVYIGLGTKEKEIPLEDSLNKVASKMIAPYPPGIPVICPGEIINEECLSLLMRMRRENKLIYGISDEGMVRIFED